MTQPPSCAVLMSAGTHTVLVHASGHVHRCLVHPVHTSILLNSKVVPHTVDEQNYILAFKVFTSKRWKCSHKI